MDLDFPKDSRTTAITVPATIIVHRILATGTKEDSLSHSERSRGVKRMADADK